MIQSLTIHYYLSSYDVQNSHLKMRSDGSASKCIPVKSGVLQETVLGPLMFLISMLTILVNWSLRLFADHCMLYWVTSSPEHCSLIHQWSQLWQWNFNITKMCYFEILQINITDSNKLVICWNSNVQEHSYQLGVISDHTMSLSSHVNHVVSKIITSSLLIGQQ